MHKAKSISTSSIKDGFVQLKISNSRSFSSLLSASFLSSLLCQKQAMATHPHPPQKTQNNQKLTLQTHLWCVNKGLVYCKQQGAISQEGALCHCQQPKEMTWEAHPNQKASSATSQWRQLRTVLHKGSYIWGKKSCKNFNMHLLWHRVWLIKFNARELIAD